MPNFLNFFFYKKKSTQLIKSLFVNLFLCQTYSKDWILQGVIFDRC